MFDQRFLLDNCWVDVKLRLVARPTFLQTVLERLAVA